LDAFSKAAEGRPLLSFFFRQDTNDILGGHVIMQMFPKQFEEDESIPLSIAEAVFATFPNDPASGIIEHEFAVFRFWRCGRRFQWKGNDFFQMLRQEFDELGQENDDLFRCRKHGY